MGAQAAMGARWVVHSSLPIFALCLGCFLILYLDIDMGSSIAQTLALLGNAAALATPAPPAVGAPPRPEFSLLIGVLTTPYSYETRHRLRLVYGVQLPTTAEIDVRFVMCNLANEEQRVLVALEILLYDDIIVLNCTENMNDGKTYTYFSSLARILPRRYDYVMKADDDTFFRLEPLVATLATQPREDLYFGCVIPCDQEDPFGGHYMSGMGYLLSWDLVEWIPVANITAADVIGPEDMMVGWWLDKGGKAKNRYSVKPRMYDYPGTNGPPCAHELVPDTVAVHKLKTLQVWVTTLSYFNVTRGLKSSKLYHIG